MKKQLSFQSFLLLYPFVGLLVALVAGVLLQQFVINNIDAYYLWTALFIFFGLLIFVLFKRNVSSTIRFLAIGLMFISIGAISSYYANVRNAQNWFGHFIVQAEAWQVKISDNPIAKSKTVLLPLEVEKAFIHNEWIHVKGNVPLYIFQNDSLPKYSINDKLLLPNNLNEIKNNGNPFGFDYAQYAARQGLYYQAFLPNDQVLLLSHKKEAPNIIDQLRNSLMTSIEQNVKDSNTVSLIEAVMLNERATLNEDIWKAYSTTGIVHIIAISGGHIAIFCSIILGIFYYFKNPKWNIVKYGLAITFVWLYIILTQYPPSAVRAAIMFTIYALALMINRSHKPINTLCATGFLMIIYNPYWIFDVGVQLSFLAVLSIMLFYSPIVRLWNAPNKIVRWLWQLMALSLSVQILVFPLVIYYFHQFPLWVFVANIPASVFSVLLMVGAILLFLLSAFIPCVWLGNILISLTHSFHAIILWMAHYTPDSYRELYIDKMDYWLIMLCIVLFAVYVVSQRKGFLLTALIACCVLITSFILQDVVAIHQEKLVVYNAGKNTLIDYFRGKNVYTYPSDSVNDKTYNYCLKPARLGYRISHAYKSQQPIWRLNNKTILLLNDNFERLNDRTFPVDYLIVTNQCRYLPQLWQKIFSPRMIIIDGSVSRSKAIRWKNNLLQAGANVYSIPEQGAWEYVQR